MRNNIDQIKQSEGVYTYVFAKLANSISCIAKRALFFETFEQLVTR